MAVLYLLLGGAQPAATSDHLPAPTTSGAAQ
jgi:hypothetical protein